MRTLNRWEDLYADLHGDFIDDIQCYTNKIEVMVGKWKITIDTSVISSGNVSCDLTRMRARYNKMDNFKFHIHRKTPFEKFMDFLTKNRTIFDKRYSAFEHDFVIKTNNKMKIENLLSNPKILQRIESQSFMVFEITDNEKHLGMEMAESTSEISIQIAGVIDDPVSLKSLVELFCEVLKQLCLLESAA